MTLNEWMILMQKGILPPLAALLLFLAAAYGAGTLVTGRKSCGLLSLTLGLLLLGWLCRVGDRLMIAFPAAVLWIIMAAPALFGVWRLVRSFPDSLRREWRTWSIFAMLGAFTLGSALLVPYTWDEQSYQIALLYRYLDAGSTAVLMDNPYSALASMPHFSMLWGVKTGGLLFPRLLMWSVYLIAAAGFYRELRRFGSRTALALSVAFLLSPLVPGMARELYQEPFILLLLPAASMAARSFRSRPLMLAGTLGLFAGMAVAVKVTGGAAALIIGGVFCCALARTDRNDWLKLLLGFAGTAFLAALPFYWRAFQATGNFFYPFGAVQVADYHTLLGRSRLGLEGAAGVFTGWLWAAFDRKIFDGFVTGWQLPLALLLGTAGWYFTARRGHLKRFPGFLFLLGGGLFYYLFWSLTSQQTRFLLPFLFPTAWFAASGLAVLPRRWKNAGLAALLLAALISIAPDLEVVRHYYLSWRSLEASRKEPAGFAGFAGRDPAYFNMLRHLADSTPEDARIMLLFERRGLYVPRDYVLGTPFFQERYFTPVPESAAEVETILAADGITHILLTAGPSPRNPDPLPEYDGENEKLTLLLLELLKRGKLAMEPVAQCEPYLLLKVMR